MVVVCAAVVAGPASSGTIANLWIHGTGVCDIINFSTNNDDYKVFSGAATVFNNTTVTWDPFINYTGTLDATGDGLVKLASFDATCPPTGSNCSFGLNIGFDGIGFSEQVTFGHSLDGTAAAGTAGNFRLQVVHNDQYIADNTLPFSASGGGLINAGPLTFVANLPGGGEDPLGKFQVQARLSVTDLAPGASLSLSEDSADITFEDTGDASGIPEPGSALLLLGGFAMMEFLRRKVRG
jgi:hypothetical protein